jgi:replication factor C small subunit
MIWTEKYKPQEFSEIIGLDNSILEYIKSGSMPSMLFFGPAGTGKTTTAKMIINKRKATYLLLNASEERGIDTIREKVKSFAMTLSPDGTQKIILLDEVDNFTKDAFASLRGVMDTYSKNCIFILTCNYVEKVIDPVKSRCVCVEFKLPDKHAILSKLLDICEKEKVGYDTNGLKNIVKSTYPDIRRAIKELESLHLRFKDITEKVTNKLLSRPKEILELLKTNKLLEAIKLYESEFLNEELLMVEIADELFYGEYPEMVKMRAMTTIREAYVDMSRIETKKLVIRPFLKSIMEIFK